MSDLANTLQRPAMVAPRRGGREPREGLHVEAQPRGLLLEERARSGGALLIQAVVQERERARIDRHVAGGVAADLDRRLGVGEEDRNGAGEGHHGGFAEHGAADELAAVAGDPDADGEPL